MDYFAAGDEKLMLDAAYPEQHARRPIVVVSRAPVGGHMRTSIKHLLLASNLLAVIGTVSTAAAQTPPIPITADQAFDSVQKQVDPITGAAANVVLVDVRTRAEYYWVGTACMVNSVTL